MKVNELETPQSGKPTLVLISSLDGIREESKLCQLQLFIYKLSAECKSEPINNFYLEKAKFYCNPSLKEKITATTIRKEIDAMLKLASSEILLQIGNPARMLVNSEEDLSIILKLSEPSFT